MSSLNLYMLSLYLHLSFEFFVFIKIEAIQKATTYMSIWMFVIREMEDALDECQEACSKEGCNAESVST